MIDNKYRDICKQYLQKLFLIVVEQYKLTPITTLHSRDRLLTRCFCLSLQFSQPFQAAFSTVSLTTIFNFQITATSASHRNWINVDRSASC